MKIANVKPTRKIVNDESSLPTYFFPHSYSYDDITSIETFGVETKCNATSSSNSSSNNRNKRKRLKLSEFILYDSKQMNAVSILNNSAMKSKTKLTYENLCAEKGAGFVCKLYIQDTFICEGTGTTVKIAKKDVSEKGIYILRTTTPVINVDMMKKLEIGKQNQKQVATPTSNSDYSPLRRSSYDDLDKPKVASVVCVPDRSNLARSTNEPLPHDMCEPAPAKGPRRRGKRSGQSRNHKPQPAKLIDIILNDRKAGDTNDDNTLECSQKFPVFSSEEELLDEAPFSPVLPPFSALPPPLPFGSQTAAQNSYSYSDFTYRKPVLFHSVDYQSLYGIGDQRPSSQMSYWDELGFPPTHGAPPLPPHELISSMSLTRTSVAGQQPRVSGTETLTGFPVGPPRCCGAGASKSPDAKPSRGPSAELSPVKSARDPEGTAPDGVSQRRIDEAVLDVEEEAAKHGINLAFQNTFKEIDDDDYITSLHECNLIVNDKMITVAKSTHGKNVTCLRALMEAVNVLRARIDMARFITMVCSHAERLYKLTGEYGLHVQYSLRENVEAPQEDWQALSQSVFLCDVYIADQLVASAADVSESAALETACKRSFETLVHDPGQLGYFQSIVISRDCAPFAK